MATPGAKKPVMDVSRPGDVAADATTRPIITGHEILKDPMMKPLGSEPATAEEAKATEDQKIAPPSSAHKVIKPLESTEAEAADKTTEKPEPPKPEESTSSEDAVVGAVLEQVGDKKKDDKPSEEDLKREELVETLVEQKKYFLPISEAKAHRNGRILLIVLALLVIAGGVVMAADAGVIDLGFKLPFDLIKNS